MTARQPVAVPIFDGKKLTARDHFPIGFVPQPCGCGNNSPGERLKFIFSGINNGLKPELQADTLGA
jgi:hypothetical protein